MRSIQRIWNRHGDGCWNGHELGVTTVPITARGPKFRTQIFFTALAPPANITGQCVPAHPNTLNKQLQIDVLAAVDHRADDLMAENPWDWRGHSALDLVQFRVADGAGFDLNLQLTGCRLWFGQFDPYQWIAILLDRNNLLELEGAHHFCVALDRNRGLSDRRPERFLAE